MEQTGIYWNRVAVHVALFVFKTTLALGGATAARDWRKMGASPTDSPPAMKKASTFSADRLWCLAYCIMNLVDIVKTATTDGSMSEHIHHAATAWGYALNAGCGSPRTMKLARITLIAEVRAFMKIHSTQ